MPVTQRTRRFVAIAKKAFSRELVDHDAEISTPMRWAGQARSHITERAHVIKAVLYGLQNFYAFMIM